MQIVQTVKVLYKSVDGAHFFVSNDEATLGLCVANKNLEKAFKAVGPTLKKLFAENYGIDAEFKPNLSLLEFKKQLNDRNKEARMKPVRGVAKTFPWTVSNWSEAA